MPDLVIVGAGSMGSKHARAAAGQREWSSVMVVDVESARAREVACQYGIQAGDVESGLAKASAVVVAVPDTQHEAVALQALKAGLHVLVEKPLAPTLEAATRIVDAAAGTDRLLVGHIERFNPASIEALRWSDEAIHVEFRRVGPRASRTLGDVVADLMIHDLDLFGCMLRQRDESVVEVVAMWSGPEREMCTALIRGSKGLSATITASRMSQAKIRSMIVTTPTEQVVADLINQSVSIHRISHIEFVNDGRPGYRQQGVLEVPFLEHGEPLQLEHKHFLSVVGGAAAPVVDGQAALAAMELVELVRAAAGQ